MVTVVVAHPDQEQDQKQPYLKGKEKLVNRKFMVEGIYRDQGYPGNYIQKGVGQGRRRMGRREEIMGEVGDRLVRAEQRRTVDLGAPAQGIFRAGAIGENPGEGRVGRHFFRSI